MVLVMTPLGLIAQLASTTAGLVFSGGVVLTLIGLYLRWRWPEYRMTTEEWEKEGRLTETQARRRRALMRFGGPAIILFGAVLFGFVFWN